MIQKRRFGQAAIDGAKLTHDGARVDRALVVAFCFAVEVLPREDGGVHVRGGPANEAIARLLIEPPFLSMPKVLEFPIAVAYAKLVGADPALIEASNRGGWMSVDQHRNGERPEYEAASEPRISAAEVAVQAGAVLGTPILSAMPVVPVAIPWMYERCVRDMRDVVRGLPVATRTKSPVLSIADLGQRLVALRKGPDTWAVPLTASDGWTNPHTWTASGPQFRLRELGASVRDAYHLRRPSQRSAVHSGNDQATAEWQAALRAIRAPADFEPELGMSGLSLGLPPGPSL